MRATLSCGLPCVSAALLAVSMSASEVPQAQILASQPPAPKPQLDAQLRSNLVDRVVPVYGSKVEDPYLSDTRTSGILVDVLRTTAEIDKRAVLGQVKPQTAVVVMPHDKKGMPDFTAEPQISWQGEGDELQQLSALQQRLDDVRGAINYPTVLERQQLANAQAAITKTSGLIDYSLNLQLKAEQDLADAKLRHAYWGQLQEAAIYESAQELLNQHPRWSIDKALTRARRDTALVALPDPQASYPDVALPTLSKPIIEEPAPVVEASEGLAGDADQPSDMATEMAGAATEDAPSPNDTQTADDLTDIPVAEINEAESELDDFAALVDDSSAPQDDQPADQTDQDLAWPDDPVAEAADDTPAQQKPAAEVDDLAWPGDDEVVAEPSSPAEPVVDEAAGAETAGGLDDLAWPEDEPASDPQPAEQAPVETVADDDLAWPGEESTNEPAVVAEPATEQPAETDQADMADDDLAWPGDDEADTSVAPSEEPSESTPQSPLRAVLLMQQVQKAMQQAVLRAKKTPSASSTGPELQAAATGSASVSLFAHVF